MTGQAWNQPVPGPCPRCTGYGDAHYLTCPTLRLPPQSQWHWLRTLENKPLTLLEASDVMNRRLADAAEAGMSVREAVAAWGRDVPP